jgi:hypothetical protein
VIALSLSAFSFKEKNQLTRIDLIPSTFINSKMMNILITFCLEKTSQIIEAISKFGVVAHLF